MGLNPRDYSSRLTQDTIMSLLTDDEWLASQDRYTGWVSAATLAWGAARIFGADTKKELGEPFRQKVIRELEKLSAAGKVTKLGHNPSVPLTTGQLRHSYGGQAMFMETERAAATIRQFEKARDLLARESAAVDERIDRINSWLIEQGFDSKVRRQPNGEVSIDTDVLEALLMRLA